MRFLIIASTPRVGSNLLGDLLEQNGIGNPAEYFNPYTGIPHFAREFGANSFGQYWEELRIRKTQNNVLAVKAHFEHFNFARTKLPILSDKRLENPVFLQIKRRDKLRQAISYLISRHTQRWTSDRTSIRRAEDLLSLGDEELFSQIRTYMLNLQIREMFWEELFDTFGVEKDVVFYEDLIDGRVAYGEKLGMSVDIPLVPERARFDRLSSEVNVHLYNAAKERLSLGVGSDCAASYGKAIQFANVFFSSSG